MNPNNMNSGMELPPPVPAESVPEVNYNPEQVASSVQETTPKSQPLSQVVPPPLIPLPTPPPAVPQTASNAPTNATSKKGFSLLHDKELIDKVYVDKAKAIVEKTKDDPYKQNEELTMLRADYMIKEHNKSIKITQ